MAKVGVSDKLPNAAAAVAAADVKATPEVTRPLTKPGAQCVGRVEAGLFWSAFHRWQDTVCAPKPEGF